MNKKRKKNLFVFLIILSVTAIASISFSAYHAYERYYKVSIEIIPDEITARHLSNPYRGWYHLGGQVLSETDPLNKTEILSKLNKSTNLTLMEINLRNYKSTNIGTQGLAQLDELFSCWRTAGIPIILRFLYDWNGNAMEAEPDSIAQILRHMDQVAPIVNKYKDIIYVIQGSFVGNVGEMHSSNYADPSSMTRLVKHLDSVIDPSIFLAVRTPAMWRTINQSFQPASKEDAFSGSLKGRVSLFNDGMLGSKYDLGTYGEDSLKNAQSYTAKCNLGEELAFQNKLCAYVPNGGEAVLDDRRSDFSNALASLGTMRVSYLNYDHDRTTLDKWKEATYHGSDCFDGTDGLTYIGEHLGYRYALSNLSLSFDWKKDQTASLSLDLQNQGFSGSYRKFDSHILLVPTQTGKMQKLPIDFDNRFLTGGGRKTLTLAIKIRDMAPGTYKIYFSMKDPALNQMIELANSYTLSKKLGCQLGTLTIQKNP